LTFPSVNVQYTHLDRFEFDVVSFLSQAKGIKVLLIGIVKIIFLIIICLGINFFIYHKCQTKDRFSSNCTGFCFKKIRQKRQKRG
jgi:hypothetical protein